MVPRRAGKLLNVASIGAFAPAPGGATYSATKAFVLSFTEALHDEVAKDGVHVTALCPGFTRTDFQQRAGVRTTGIPSAGLERRRRRWWPPAWPPSSATRPSVSPGVVNKMVAVSPALRAPGPHPARSRPG